MEENKEITGWKQHLAEAAILIIGAGGMWLFGGLRQESADRLLANCVMTVLGLAVVGFHFNREVFYQKQDYNNGSHPLRFLACFSLGLVISFICGFLPAGGWPFLFVFVMLALFSNMSTGILASSILLLLSVLLRGGAADSVGIYALYLVSGMFAVTLFRHLENDFKIGVPLFLSILFLLVCETANIVLVANARPEFELFVIPVANMIISSILLLGLLKLFSSMVVYQYRERYLDISDTENPVLSKFREENRLVYMHSIHTAHFCETIGKRLGLDTDALKCAAYYHEMGDKLEAVMEELQFPPRVREILTGFQLGKMGIVEKEPIVLLCSDTVVNSISFMQQNGAGRKIDYDRVIDAVFKKLYEEGSFERCDMTVKELREMIKIFKEEKLYYDFLR